MSLDEWVQIAIGAGTVGAFLIAYITIKRDQRKDSVTGSENRIRELARTEDEPLKERLHDHSTRLTQANDRLSRMEELLKGLDSGQRVMSDQLAGMVVKVDFYWGQQAMNAAKSLHQPDPRRQHVDSLLEAFMEGTLTSDERVELKKILVQIRNWEPGKELDFPVHAGEPTAAAILLGTMDLVDPQRMAMYGHALHRNHDTQGL